MTNGKRKGVVLSNEQTQHANKTMENLAGEHGLLCVNVSDWKIKKSESEKWYSARASN
jgi:predicted rRNA methylase YqxC with S4 and FtsJ domains